MGSELYRTQKRMLESNSVENLLTPLIWLTLEQVCHPPFGP